MAKTIDCDPIIFKKNTVPDIANWLGFHPNTVRTYIRAFENGSFNGLKPIPQPGRPATLDWEKPQWDDLLAQSPADFDRLQSGAKNWTQGLLCTYLDLYHGLKVSQPVLGRHLKKVGIAWKRIRLRVHSPDPLYQVKRERVEGLRQMALNGELSPSKATHPPPDKGGSTNTYFVYFDAADLHWCPDLGATYSTVGEQVKVDSPGKSNPWYAILGSLIYPSGDGYYTIHDRKRSVEVVWHLQGLIDLDPDGFWFVVLDNASAHRTKAIDSFIENHRDRIELVYLPTYSPHLNLIERLWRMMRHQVTRGVFFNSLDEQAIAVQGWLDQLPFGRFCSVMGVDEKQLSFV